jgi:hypothetical protein
MPWTAKQKGLFGADLARAKKGKKTRTGMSAGQLRKALHEPTKKASPKKTHHKVR